MEFKLRIIPPTVTAQEHRVRVVHGKPMFYDSKKLKETRRLFETLLRIHAPEAPLKGPVGLAVEWRFLTKTYREGSWRITRPDTDNLEKLLKDCMTKAGFWNDDAQVCKEVVTKKWARKEPGIVIKVVKLDDNE